jgi:hypothetical protein
MWSRKMMVKITADYSFYKPFLADGATNPFWNNVLVMTTRGIKVKKVGNLGIVEISDVDDMSLEDVVNIDNIGGKVEGYPCFIKVPIEKYNLNIPYNDDITWEDINSKPEVDATFKDDIYYFGSHSITGTPLTSSEIVDYQSFGYEFIHINEFKSMVNHDED